MREFRRRQRLWRDKAGGEEKNLIKRRVERQKVFSSPPAINQSSFITHPIYFAELSRMINLHFKLAGRLYVSFASCATRAFTAQCAASARGRLMVESEGVVHSAA